MQKLPAGYAAAARKEGDLLVIVIDTGQVEAAHARGDLSWGVDLVNGLADALEGDMGGLSIAV